MKKYLTDILYINICIKCVGMHLKKKNATFEVCPACNSSG